MNDTAKKLINPPPFCRTQTYHLVKEMVDSTLAIGSNCLQIVEAKSESELHKVWMRVRIHFLVFTIALLSLITFVFAAVIQLGAWMGNQYGASAAIIGSVLAVVSVLITQMNQNKENR